MASKKNKKPSSSKIARNQAAKVKAFARRTPVSGGFPSASSRTPLRAPRTGILHGEDPTLAKRVEEELHDLGR